MSCLRCFTHGRSSIASPCLQQQASLYLSHPFTHSLDYQSVDLVEKPVGSSLFITQPAASVLSTEVNIAFDYDEVPSLLFNSDYTKLAVVFNRFQVVKLLSVTLSSSAPVISPLSELTGITSFAWSYTPAKYATVEDGRLYITVYCLSHHSSVGYDSVNEGQCLDPR